MGSVQLPAIPEKMPQALLLLCLLLLPALGQAGSECAVREPPPERWRLVQETLGAQIFEPTEEGVYPQGMARVQWHVQPERLYEQIWHYEHFAEFVPDVVRSEVLERRPREVWVYQRLRFPGPIQDRQYVMRSEDTSEPEQHHYRVRWELSPQPLPPDHGDFPLPEAFRGCWDIEAGTGGGLDAIYWIELAPGGWVPDFAVSNGMRQYLEDLTGALRRRLGIP